VLRTRKVESVSSRLMRHRNITVSGCWEWLGGRTKNGYGLTNVGSRSGGAKRKTVYVHRASFELNVGPIPNGLELDHLCRNRLCFNPNHLELVTRAENTRRGIGPMMLARINGGKKVCKNGHLFMGSNIIRRGPSGRWRKCRLCEKATSERRRLPNGYIARRTVKEEPCTTPN